MSETKDETINLKFRKNVEKLVIPEFNGISSNNNEDDNDEMYIVEFIIETY